VTFSIVALDPATGDLGVAVASKFLAVGGVVPFAAAGVGAVATQAHANVAFGPRGLELMRSGRSAEEALAELVAGDDLRDERQAGLVDAAGRAATFTGGHCFAWAGGRSGPGVAVQGNILARAGVVDDMYATFTAAARPFPELLVACLAAAEQQGGDRRGRQSAALLVVRVAGGYGGGNDRWIDLRVDDHPRPVDELARLLALHRLYLNRPQPEQLLALNSDLAAELRALLGSVNTTPGQRAPVYERMGEPPAAGEPAEEETSRVGEPRPLPAGWDESWQFALESWMSIENLEERLAARGWVDPVVLDYLRQAATRQG
jgi:uncharacterized Ntn-hydrolase superfamily protein